MQASDVVSNDATPLMSYPSKYLQGISIMDKLELT
jgi:hypothetical protein